MIIHVDRCICGIPSLLLDYSILIIFISPFFQNATHMLDISGEPQYLEKMQLKYHEQAKQSGVYVISSCGFDSIPADCGVNFLKKHFEPGIINSVEGFIKSKSGPEGTRINHGTWDSLLTACLHWRETESISAELYATCYKKKYPQFKYSLASRKLPFYSPEARGWCVPFWETDRTVVKRSQMFFYDTTNERPVQLEQYTVVPNVFAAYMVTLVSALIRFAGCFSWTNNLLLSYPSIFSFGAVTKEGPSRKQVADSSFQMFLVAKGWKVEESEYPPNKTLVAKISGPEVAYDATSIMLVQAGVTVLLESDKMPFKGGVLPPGFAFHDTDLIERLGRHDVKFETVQV